MSAGRQWQALALRGTAAALLAAACAGALAQAPTTYRWVDGNGRVNYSDQPPPASIRQLDEKRYSGAPAADTTPSYAVRQAMANFPVAVFVTQDCQAPCNLARDLLKRRGIPFQEHKLESTEEVQAYRELFGTPEQVPAITIGRMNFKGYETTAWEKMLDDAGYPKSAAAVPR
ncbi:DUF4124 domain-containing protein [Azoarcus sp. TTM-91]|uniref:DUF4124 domain-containing protein n=1 Tax=Azoarcus sp. TTM-91 TaxID=2691581 RepID=UPI00145E9CCC|nr:DUF4124 domain-containing protein [Azoarcus sp. TTM-91]